MSNRDASQTVRGQSPRPTGCRPAVRDQPEQVLAEQFGEQIDENRGALRGQTPNKNGPLRLGDTPSLRLGAGLSPVQI